MWQPIGSPLVRFPDPARFRSLRLGLAPRRLVCRAARQVERVYLDTAARRRDFHQVLQFGRLPLPALAQPQDSHSIECDVMDEGMTRSDLIFVLENLHFSRNDLARLQIDREVRDFLVRSIAPSRR
jgi:hypothetical protein